MLPRSSLFILECWQSVSGALQQNTGLFCTFREPWYVLCGMKESYKQIFTAVSLQTTSNRPNLCPRCLHQIHCPKFEIIPINKLLSITVECVAVETRKKGLHINSWLLEKTCTNTGFGKSVRFLLKKLWKNTLLVLDNCHAVKQVAVIFQRTS